ncbi:MAG: dockerin type I domain-containing protein [Anaerovoracaceae bacterium]
MWYITGHSRQQYADSCQGRHQRRRKDFSVDILMAQRCVNTYSLSGAYHSGADINGDGKISSVDILMMQRHVIGTYTIKN